MTETSESFAEAAAEGLAMLGDPRRACEATIGREEHNLAGVHVLRAKIALPATMGDRHAQKQARILDRSEERILRRLRLARIALASLQLDSKGRRGSSLGSAEVA